MKTLKVGDIVPAFSGTTHQGEAFSSADFIGNQYIVFFYPKANTPGCTAEACDLRDHYKELQDLGYQILGVSADSERQQKNFADKFDFPYPLFADTEKHAIEAFGVWGPKKFMGKEYDGIHRMTFVIDKEGKVSHIIDKVKTKEHAQQLLDIL